MSHCSAIGSYSQRRSLLYPIDITHLPVSVNNFRFRKIITDIGKSNYQYRKFECDYTISSPYRNWSSKIYDVISSVYRGFDVVFNENALHHPALPLYVQEHSMLKYQRAWLSSINKGYDPNKPNKLKAYAYQKMSPVTILPNEGTLLNYVLALIISLLKRSGTPDQSPQESNVFAIIAQKKLLAMRCISFWGVQNLYLKGDASSRTLINYMA